MTRKLFHRDMCVKIFGAIKMRHGNQSAKIDITAFILGKYWQPVTDELSVRRRPPDPKQRPNDRLHTVRFRAVLKRHNTIKAIAITNGYRGKPKLLRSFANGLRLNRAFQYGVCGIHA